MPAFFRRRPFPPGRAKRLPAARRHAIIFIPPAEDRMKKLLLAAIVLLPLLAPAQDAVAFEKYFADRTMRIDVFHTGDAKREMFTVDRVIQEGPWAGNPLRLVAPVELERYLLRVSDPASGTLLYCKGFDSYFSKYTITEPGVNGVQKT